MLNEDALNTPEVAGKHIHVGALRTGPIRVEGNPAKPLGQIRRAIWRMPEGQARREMERISANVRDGRRVLLALDAQGHVVGAASHDNHGRKLWIVNLAATGEVAGAGTALLRAAARLALKQEGDLELAALAAARSFFLALGGEEVVETTGGRSIRWRGEALRRLAEGG
jgi:hypothetical protein